MLGPHEIRNERLLRAIQVVVDAPLDDLSGDFRALLDELVKSTLIAARDPDTSVVETGEDEVFLALFTDVMELFAFESESAWVTMTAEDALRSVARGDYDGLVINPAGKAFELSRNDIEDMFEIE